MNIESIILSNLALNEEFGRKVLPFLKEEYFQNREDRTVFKLINAYVDKYNRFPSKQALGVDLQELKNLTGPEFTLVQGKIEGLALDPKNEQQWLLDKTENFCSWQAIKNALYQSIKIVDGQEKGLETGAIPKILSDALAVSFDTNIGHDFMKDWEKRYDCYHRVEQRVPFDIDILNKITGGGLPKQSFNCIVASTGVGKTLMMCHFAKTNILKGKNTLYITLEMGEIGDPSISQRIEANILDIELDKLRTLPKDAYQAHIASLKQRVTGKLIIKGYPTASAGSGHFRFLINELRLKRNFVPDIIYVDYINNCLSSRMKMGQNVSSYTYIKSIAEELRGIAQEFDVPLVTATQLNREGSKNSDPELEHTAESWGLPHTADFMLGVFSNETLARQGQYMCKQLKSRYGNPAENTRFLLGVNKLKMRLYDIVTNEVIDSKSTTRAVMAARNNVGFDADAFLDGA